VVEAMASGMLTLGQLRNGVAATRALVPEAISPAPVHAPAERSDEAAELLDDFLIALLELPGDA
jgi:hypothetical protein